jgi:hypothetical protein
MTATDPPQPVAKLVGVVSGQQADEDFRGVTHTRLRHNRACGSFALDHDRFGGARWGEDAVGQVPTVRQGELMLDVEVG